MFNKRTSDSFSKIFTSSTFPVGVELVSTRGWFAGQVSKRVLSFAEILKSHPAIDWVSITDNAGGHPRMAPLALGMPILYGGKEVIVHLTAKDMNRHAIESQLWLLASHGFNNVLALTGDHPSRGPNGRAKPVFDLDSIGILALMKAMNGGGNLGDSEPPKAFQSTQFHSGCTVNPHKPDNIQRHLQYLKLENKINNGAQFVIPQIGFNLDDLKSLRQWMDRFHEKKVPLIGNAFLSSPKVLDLFVSGKIPGVHLSRETHAKMIKQSCHSKAKNQFLRYTALWMVALEKIGFDGCYLGGISNHQQLESLLELHSDLRNADPFPELDTWLEHERPSHEKDVSFLEKTRLNINEAIHDVAFSESSPITQGISKFCRNLSSEKNSYKAFHSFEKVSKGLTFNCRDCGDCLLPKTAYLCPQSGCAKKLRNGPCGGSKADTCEVKNHECFWSRAFRGMKHLNREEELLPTSPNLLDHDLKGTSGWINHWKSISLRSKREPLCQSQTSPSLEN